MLGSMRGAAREAIACMQHCPLRHCLLKACVTKVHYVCLHALQPWLGQPWLGCAVHALSAVLGPCCTVSCMSGCVPRARWRLPHTGPEAVLKNKEARMHSQPCIHMPVRRRFAATPVACWCPGASAFGCAHSSCLHARPPGRRSSCLRWNHLSSSPCALAAWLHAVCAMQHQHTGLLT